MSWIVCQIGAREHYAVARALQQSGSLASLVTEFWVPPGSFCARFSPRLAQRFHLELASASLRTWNTGSVAFEMAAKLRGKSGWPLILARNQWFQGRALRALSRLQPQSQTLFAYSYAARDLFRWAKTQGMRTVLGQIDGGLADEKLMVELHQRHAAKTTPWSAAPRAYWEGWREECELADCIAVNSEWSRTLLAREGVPQEKLRVVPLAYTPPPEAVGFERSYPDEFTAARPLRVLFLGQVNMRKGVAELLAAASELAEAPVEFWVVGPVQLNVAPEDQSRANVRWVGPVSRADAADWYRRADVFLFPTHSDGFGLTQLEAQAWNLPIIASHHCGEVVKDGRNGVRLPEISGAAIAAVLGEFVKTPDKLRALAAASGIDERFTVNALASALLSL